MGLMIGKIAGLFLGFIRPSLRRAEISKKHTSGVKTPLHERRRIAGNKSPAYRPNEFFLSL
jgi:hypothetical protein